MNIKLETLRTEYEIGVFFDRLLKTPHKLEIKLGRRIVTSNIINHSKGRLFLSEFQPYYANSLIKTIPHVTCTIKELDGFDEISYTFKAKFSKETEANYLPAFEYRILGSIKGLKRPYQITPSKTDNCMLFIHLDNGENLELPVEKLTYEEIFLSGKNEQLEPYIGYKINNISLGIPGDEPNKNKQLVFDGVYTHIYGNSYSLTGVSESVFNRDLMLAYAKKNFSQIHNIKFFNRNGRQDSENNAEKDTRILLICDLQLTSKKFTRSLKVLKNIEVIVRTKPEGIAEYCQHFNPHLFFVDLDTENINFKNVKQVLNESKIPYYVLSHSSNITLLKQALNLGASGYLLKPIDSTALIKKIKAITSGIKPKIPLNQNNPLICYFTDSHTKNIDFIKVLFDEYGNAENYSNHGVKVVNSAIRMKNFALERGTDFVIIDCVLSELSAIKIIEKLRLSRLTSHIQCVVLANSELEYRLLNNLNDDRCIVIQKNSPEQVVQSLKEFSLQN